MAWGVHEKKKNGNGFEKKKVNRQKGLIRLSGGQTRTGGATRASFAARAMAPQGGSRFGLCRRVARRDGGGRGQRHPPRRRPTACPVTAIPPASDEKNSRRPHCPVNLVCWGGTHQIHGDRGAFTNGCC
ncbi:hypothetical protein TW95_gp1504 [Pandoravirus inopinatum]|uniref:Uncharacterized protein n=1 Tax=Pandoravirus inopinatum TaxID=1605721 RepID=A0A0B5IZC6_9VIRU|nr:hypothetical protein TW95_gp1504 [Pandoravirus inopinatum]AJF98238.1 hypothetical protein [Pandoravirus inopinatum]